MEWLPCWALVQLLHLTDDKAGDPDVEWHPNGYEAALGGQMRVCMLRLSMPPLLQQAVRLHREKQ